MTTAACTTPDTSTPDVQNPDKDPKIIEACESLMDYAEKIAKLQKAALPYDPYNTINS